MTRVNGKKKTKKLIPIIIILFTVLAASTALLIYIYTQNYITVEYFDKTSDKITSEEVSKVNPIIINNIIMGGVTDKGSFVKKDILDSKNKVEKGMELDMYSLGGKIGTYEIYNVSYDEKREITHVMPFKEKLVEEYIAIQKSDDNIMPRTVKKFEVKKTDIKDAKKALGKYRLFNNTVNVHEAYETKLTKDRSVRIISVTSSGENTFGVYSAIIAIEGDNAQIIKYSYVKNTKSSVKWPVYSFKFACDLNNDGKYELVIQEARELTMKYCIMEYQKNKYKEVLGVEIKI
ncbi:MAG: hypothetical protein PHR25_03270 [Clostridia bacterium]|nr:hypothetical protein [Clostridia bacterium]MDD4375781.1 hypothetical protein [Clostridia bacterium]